MIRAILSAVLNARRERRVGHAWRAYHSRQTDLWAMREGHLERELRLLRAENAALLDGNTRLIGELETARDALKAERDARFDADMAHVAEVTEMRQKLAQEDSAHGKTVAQRDAFEERINEIANALGDESEWTNLNDRGENALELAHALRAQLAEKEAELRKLRDWVEHIERGARSGTAHVRVELLRQILAPASKGEGDG